jgi:hypothetical protein
MSAKFCAALVALAFAAIAPGPVLAHGGAGYGYAHPYHSHGYADHQYAYAYPYHLRSYCPKYPFALRRFGTDPDPTVRFDLNRDAKRGRS